jgi:hypothetical protein
MQAQAKSNCAIGSYIILKHDPVDLLRAILITRKETEGIKFVNESHWGRVPAHFSQTKISGLPIDLV